jgi:hypothetical protein
LGVSQQGEFKNQKRDKQNRKLFRSRQSTSLFLLTTYHVLFFLLLLTAQMQRLSSSSG